MNKFYKIVAKIYEYGSVLFLIVVAIIGVITLWSKIKPNGSVRILSVISGSMTPTIPVGSGVLVIPQSYYQSGDIVTYKLGKQFITHRIVFDHNYFLTKGDANKQIDTARVLPTQIIGKVYFILPFLGYIQESTKSLYGLIGFVWIPTLLIIGHEIWIIIRELKRKKVENSIPIGLFIGFLFLFSFKNSYSASYFTDTQQLSGSLESQTLTPSPSISPTVLPTPTIIPTSSPTATPTVSPIPSPSITPSPTGIGNTGNGSGSTNVVIINDNTSVEVNQSNTSTQTNNVTNTVNTGNNSGGSVNTASGSAQTTINTSSNSNTVVIH